MRKNSRVKRWLALILCMTLVLSTNTVSMAAEESGTEVPEAVEEENTDLLTATETEPATEAPTENTAGEMTVEAGTESTESGEDSGQMVETTETDGTTEQTGETEEPTNSVEEPEVSTEPIDEASTESVEEIAEGVPVTELCYENEKVTVVVSAESKDAIPVGAQLKVVPITSQDEETKAQYEEVKEQIQTKADEEEKEIAGFLAYDITFVDEQGNEMEPNGEVKVSIEYKDAALPEGISETDAKDIDVTVFHLEENENGEVKEVVDMSQVVPEGKSVEEAENKIHVLETTEEKKVEKVEVVTGSFSAFTIVWNRFKTLKGIVVDDTGKEISGITSQEISAKEKFDFTEIKEGGQKEELYEIENTEGQKYVFLGAYRAANEITGESILEGEKLSYVNSRVWDNIYYCVSGETEEKEFNTKDYELYFVYQSSVSGVGEVDTIKDAKGLGISINLFNYNSAVNNQKIPAAKEGFQFHNSQQGVDGGNNLVSAHLKYTHAANQKIHQNYLESYLSEDGYPILKDSSKGTTLGYLFGGAETKEETDAVTGYTDLNGLLYKDSEGYYTYASSDYHAQLIEDENRVAVYKATLAPDAKTFQYGNFLPFNQLPDNAKEGMLSGVDGGMSKTDYWYGMNIGAMFIQPKDGLLNGKAMKFEFAGDDDAWVFIDGVKVLDIGGIHDKKEGSIDFQTGEVVVQFSQTETTTYKLADLYQTAYQEKNPQATQQELEQYMNRYFEKDDSGYTVYKDFVLHDMKFFYLERGAGASNCKVRFNLPTIPKDSILIEKQIENYDAGAYSDVEFSYELYINDTLQKSIPYTLIKADGTEESKTVGADGIFKLKHREKAKFDNLKLTDEYKVKEVGIESGTYDYVKIESAGIKDEHKLDIQEGETEAIESRKLTVGENQYILFLNRCAVTNMKHLVIKKEFQGTADTADYQMQVTVGGKLYDGMYKVGSSYEDAMGSEQILQTEKGIVSLKVNQVAVILGNASLDGKRGIPSGTTFKVEELLEDDGVYQTPKYEVTEGTASDKKTVDGFFGTGYAEGKIILKNNAEITVTNAKKDTPPEEEIPDDVPHNKYIDYLGDKDKNEQTNLTGDDYYRLYLDVKGIPNVEPVPADIVLILDYSSSMNSNFGAEGKHRWDYVTQSAQIAVDTLLSKNSGVSAAKKNKIGIIWFDRRANVWVEEDDNGQTHQVNMDFTSDETALLDNIKKMKPDSGTNYQAAFWNAQKLLSKSESERKKFVIFVTDGEPYQYYDGKETEDNLKSDGQDKAKAAAKEAAGLFNQLNGFYAVSVGKDTGTKFLRDDIAGSVPASVKDTIIASNENELRDAFKEVLGSITKQIGNVTIQDTLSEYVTFADEKGAVDLLGKYDKNKDGILQGSVTKGEKDEIAEALGLKVNTYMYNKETYDFHTDIKNAKEYTGSYTYEINLNTNTIAVNFGSDYFLERDVVYTLSFNVKLTDKATKDAMDREQTLGDFNTDYPGNSTSSGQQGLYSNKKATVTYERVVNGEKESKSKEYERPVVQPYDNVWEIKKVNEGGTLPLQGAQFTLSNEKFQYTGISGVNGIVQWTDKNENVLNSSQEIEPGTYTMKETQAPDGYLLSKKEWTVEISAKGAKPIITCNGKEEQLKTDDNHCFVLEIENTVNYQLPESGGDGIYKYMAGGILFMTLAGMLLLYKNRRKGVLKG